MHTALAPSLPLTPPPTEAPVTEGVAAAAGLRLIELNDLTIDDLDRWDDLARHRQGTNPFAEPWMLRLSLAHCDEWRRARIGIVTDTAGGWLGVIPLRLCRVQRQLPFAMWAGWSHANQFTGTPLVRRGAEREFWQGLLAALDRRSAAPLALGLLALPLDEAVNAALLEVCARQGRRVAIDRRWHRAALEPGSSDELVPPKLRRRIAGLERKLEREVGAFSIEITREMPQIAARVEQFMRLERSGWKGRGGSALACRDDTRRFFSDAALAAAGRGQFELGSLCIDGEVIAMSTQLVSGGLLHGFKVAYDERYASYAPGLLLLHRLTQHWLDAGIAVDSCAKPDQQPLSKLWPARRELVDCRVAVGGTAQRLGFAALVAGEAAWHAGKRLLSGAASTHNA